MKSGLLAGAGVALLMMVLLSIVISGVSTVDPGGALHSEDHDESSQIELSLRADRRLLLSGGSIVSGEIIVLRHDESTNATLEGIQVAAFDSQGRIVGETHISKIRPGVKRTTYKFDTIKTPVVVTMQVATVRASNGYTPGEIYDNTQRCDRLEARVNFNQSAESETYGLCHENKAPTQTPTYSIQTDLKGSR
jgi:hypothetical protein